MHDARWSAGIYAVAGGLGVAFSVFLLSFAWQNALETARRQFAFESVSISSALGQNVAAADEVSGYLSSLLEEQSAENSEALSKLGQAALKQHRFLRGIGFQRIITSATGELSSPATLRKNTAVELEARGFFLRPDGDGSGSVVEMPESMLRAEVLHTVLESAGAVPTGVAERGPYAGSYLLARAVRMATNASDLNSRSTPIGLLFLAIDPAGLLGPSISQQSLGITLVSESEGVVGRQFIFNGIEPRGGAEEGWMITRLTEDSSVQLPNYSFKLLVSKPVYWRNIEHGLIYTALLLGAGTTLLLIALARSREAQARELRERNIEIERQVFRQTRELAVARDEALSASRVKSDFLASMSHEIRTPLNAIIGMSELLGETPLNDEQGRYVGVFRRAGEALLGLVNDILDLSKIEAGQLTLERIDFELGELVEHAVDLYALKVEENGLTLTSHISTAVPSRLNGDPTRLRQVLLNLIGNAIKFTDRGGIAVRVNLVPNEHGKCRIRFSVEDTGIGIPAEKHAAIFANFTQVDSSTTRKYGGTGLGLSISQHLVTMMDGRIWVTSSVGSGSTFSFEVNLGAAEAVEPVASLPHGIAETERQVLLITNQGLESKVLTEFLQESNFTVRLATTREQAVDFLSREESAARIDTVLCDRWVQSENGIEIASAIRRRLPHAQLILMLSASTLRADLERIRDLSSVTYIVKPVKSGELRRVMSGLVAAPLSPDVAVGRSGAGDPGSRRRLLLVEDTPDNVLLVKAFLKNESLDIDVADNGATALEMFQRGTYDLVLMDMQMPVMDGYAATRAIRELEDQLGLKPTPIIALTAHAIREDVDRCLAAGCSSHLAKPIKKATLLQALQNT